MRYASRLVIQGSQEKYNAEYMEADLQGTKVHP
jgi:hypothetical protein